MNTNGGLQCPKCSRHYLRGGSTFDSHVSGCRGLPGITKKSDEIARSMRDAARALRQDGERQIAEARKLEVSASKFERMTRQRSASASS